MDGFLWLWIVKNWTRENLKLIEVFFGFFLTFYNFLLAVDFRLQVQNPIQFFLWFLLDLLHFLFQLLVSSWPFQFLFKLLVSSWHFQFLFQLLVSCWHFQFLFQLLVSSWHFHFFLTFGFFLTFSIFVSTFGFFLTFSIFFLSAFGFFLTFYNFCFKCWPDAADSP